MPNYCLLYITILPRLMDQAVIFCFISFCLAQNQHEMFLMRKHNLDFKALAQALAMDKDKLDDYIKVETVK